VSTLTLFQRGPGGLTAPAALRRSIRCSLVCEPLELRQLLSVAQGGFSAAPVANPVPVQPTLAVAPLASAGAPAGYSPAQITTAYGINQISFGSGTTANGAGQTIAIIDAYYDPNIQKDLATFDAEYGLSAPPSFEQAVEVGLRQDNAGWALETSLDVEWAHAIAPAANILLVEAQPDLTDLTAGVTWATEQPGVSVVSMSWGTGEFSGETSYDSVFTTPTGHTGITFVAAAGDDSVSEYPAASPNVLSVGGTTLKLASAGGYGSETPWSDTGGGYSPYEAEPGWQTAAISAAGLNSGSRTTPDIAWDGNPSTGVAVYDSVPYYGAAGWWEVGGTSVGAPSVSGMIAIANQGLALASSSAGTIADAQTSLYPLSSSSTLHQISPGTTGKGTASYNLLTGLGSPKANVLVPDLVSSVAAKAATAVDPATSTGAGHSSSPQGRSAATLPTTTTNVQPLTQTSSSLPSITSVTALNPNDTNMIETHPSLAIVYVIPPPMAPPSINLAPSAAQVLSQIINSPIAMQEEQPPSVTHFGQGAVHRRPSLLVTPREDGEPADPPIDLVVPAPPGALPDAAWADPDLQPGGTAGRFFSIPGLDALFGPAASALPLDSSARSRFGADWAECASSRLPGLLSVAVVAAGGYRLAFRDRGKVPFRGRTLDRRAGGRRP
jgi:hypothetical protein